MDCLVLMSFTNSLIPWDRRTIHEWVESPVRHLPGQKGYCHPPGDRIQQAASDANPTVNGRLLAHDPSRWLGRTRLADSQTVRYWCTCRESELSGDVAMISAPVLDSTIKPRYSRSTIRLVTIPMKICLVFMPMKSGQVFEVSANDPCVR